MPDNMTTPEIVQLAIAELELPEEQQFLTADHDDKLIIIYAELRSLKRYVIDLENKAQAMTNPDNMAKMMQGFMGGMLG